MFVEGNTSPLPSFLPSFSSVRCRHYVWSHSRVAYTALLYWFGWTRSCGCTHIKLLVFPSRKDGMKELPLLIHCTSFAFRVWPIEVWHLHSLGSLFGSFVGRSGKMLSEPHREPLRRVVRKTHFTILIISFLFSSLALSFVPPTLPHLSTLAHPMLFFLLKKQKVLVFDVQLELRNVRLSRQDLWSRLRLPRVRTDVYCKTPTLFNSVLSYIISYHIVSYRIVSINLCIYLVKASLFQPDEWANLFKASGAKYVVLTSKHHGENRLKEMNRKKDCRIVH